MRARWDKTAVFRNDDHAQRSLASIGANSASAHAAYDGLLERLDVFPLAVDLTPHMLDF